MNKTFYFINSNKAIIRITFDQMISEVRAFDEDHICIELWSPISRYANIVDDIWI